MEKELLENCERVKEMSIKGCETVMVNKSLTKQPRKGFETDSPGERKFSPSNLLRLSNVRASREERELLSRYK